MQPLLNYFGLLCLNAAGVFCRQERVDEGIEADGSNLSGVSGHCLWEDTSCKTGADSSHQGAARHSDDNKENLCIGRHQGDCDKRLLSHDG